MNGDRATYIQEVKFMDGLKRQKYIAFVMAQDKYLSDLELYDALVEEKERIWLATQPHPADMSAERVDGGRLPSMMDDYMVRMEKAGIDHRLIDMAQIIAKRDAIKDKWLKELQKSNNLYDRIYNLKFVEGWKNSRIARYLSYDERSIRRHIKKIKENIELVRKCPL